MEIRERRKVEQETLSLIYHIKKEKLKYYEKNWKKWRTSSNCGYATDLVLIHGSAYLEQT